VAGVVVMVLLTPLHLGENQPMAKS
jgi:hypothetical protein